MAECKWCGAANAEDATTCANCGQPLNGGQAEAPFDPAAFAQAMSDKVDAQIAARMAEAAPAPVAPVAAVPVPASPPVTAPAAPQYQPPAQAQYQPPTTPPQQYPPPQPQYAPPPQQYPPPQPQYAPPPQQYPPPQQQYAPPQQYGYAAPPMSKPRSGLGNAIAVTILCCMPLGVVAIVYAAQVDKKWAMGDYAGAQQAAKMANLWATIGAVIGILWIIVSAIIGFSSGVNSSTSYYTY